MTTVYGESTGRSYDLGPEIGRGGGGVVHSVAGGRLVCKLPSPTAVNVPEALERVRHFARQPLGWPAVEVFEVVLEAPRARPVGFVMRQVRNAHEIGAYFDEAGRQRAGLRVDLPGLVRLAARVSEGLAVFHAHGVVAADFHDKQVLVDRAGEPHFLEPDGWELGLRVHGTYRWLRSGVGVYEYAPPEHQGVDFGATDRSVHTDRWALAVLVWRLIKGGAFPHQVQGGSVQTVYPTDLVKQGLFPHDPQATLPGGITPVDDPPEFSTFPAAVRGLFLRCFSEGAARPTSRPAADEWAHALGVYAAAIPRAGLTRWLPPMSWAGLGANKAVAAAAAALIVGASFYIDRPETTQGTADRSATGPAAEPARARERPPTPFKSAPKLWSEDEP